MALEHLRPAVELTRAIGYRPGELSAMTALGDAQRLLDRHEHAAATYQYALAVAEEIGDRNWQFEALNSLGRLHHAIGQPERALADHLEALSLSLPHWASEPTRPPCTRRHSQAHRTLGRAQGAGRHWERRWKSSPSSAPNTPKNAASIPPRSATPSPLSRSPLRTNERHRRLLKQASATVKSTDWASGQADVQRSGRTAESASRVRRGGVWASDVLTTIANARPRSSQDERELRVHFGQLGPLRVGGGTPAGADEQRVRVGE